MSMIQNLEIKRSPSLIDYLKSDLERYYHYNGRSGKVPRKRELWRNFLIPRCAPVAIYRLASHAQNHGLGSLAKLLTWMNFYLHGIEINSKTAIGPYFFMPHASGTVIGAVSIGHHAVIYHQVTIGAKEVEYEHVGRPKIGNRVLIGSGARVLGSIEIGNDCVIGANSVITKSVEANHLITGVPASARLRVDQSMQPELNTSVVR